MACDATTNYSSPPLATTSKQCFLPPVPSNTNGLQCPSNTQAGMLPLASVEQCRANAGYYYIPGSSSSTLCPINYFCPFAGLVPQICPPSVSVCSQVGQYPLPSLCPVVGLSMPAQACQNCSGLPSNAYWTSTSSALCPFCCQLYYYRSISPNNI